jgi:hypothetical protein
MSHTRFIKAAAWAGIAGPLWFAGAVLGLTRAQYDFMRWLGWDPLRAPTLDWPSGLSLGPYGWLMTATFLLSGGLMAVFALGLRRVLTGENARRATALFILAGLAMALLASPTDPTHRNTPATWHGVLHDAAFVMLGLALFAAMFLLGFVFRRDESWHGLSAYTWGMLALAAPAFFLKGLAFYAFLAGILIWSVIVALRLLNLANAGS